jgi:glycogen debranching enzyme
LHAAWRATGDQALLERHLETVGGCLSWIDNYGDRDGDGFQEYQTRSPAGYENMAWKDSGDCVVYPDGSLVKGPKALCELQGYVYSAWIRMWTGWGICTLSAGNPAFNPYNYQAGSVWPHDNGIIAMGFKLYGFGAEAGRIAHDISIGASHFLLGALHCVSTR